MSNQKSSYIWHASINILFIMTNKQKQSQRMHHKFWKRALQTRQSESRRWLNNDKLHKLQQYLFEDDCKRRWFIARK